MDARARRLAHYRILYRDLAARDPAAVARLPAPDDEPDDASLQAAIAAIEKVGARLHGVPREDLSTGA